MIQNLIILTLISGLVAFAAYPFFPRIIQFVTVLMVSIPAVGLFILFLAPRDYMQRIPEQLNTILHPYMIAPISVVAIFLFFGVSIGAFSSCLYSKRNRS